MKRTHDVAGRGVASRGRGRSGAGGEREAGRGYAIPLQNNGGSPHSNSARKEPCPFCSKPPKKASNLAKHIISEHCAPHRTYNALLLTTTTTTTTTSTTTRTTNRPTHSTSTPRSIECLREGLYIAGRIKKGDPIDADTHDATTDNGIVCPFCPQRVVLSTDAFRAHLLDHLPADTLSRRAQPNTSAPAQQPRQPQQRHIQEPSNYTQHPHPQPQPQPQPQPVQYQPRYPHQAQQAQHVPQPSYIAVNPYTLRQQQLPTPQLPQPQATQPPPQVPHERPPPNPEQPVDNHTSEEDNSMPDLITPPLHEHVTVTSPSPLSDSSTSTTSTTTSTTTLTSTASTAPTSPYFASLCTPPIFASLFDCLTPSTYTIGGWDTYPLESMSHISSSPPTSLSNSLSLSPLYAPLSSSPMSPQSLSTSTSTSISLRSSFDMFQNHGNYNTTSHTHLQPQDPVIAMLHEELSLASTTSTSETNENNSNKPLKHKQQQRIHAAVAAASMMEASLAEEGEDVYTPRRDDNSSNKAKNNNKKKDAATTTTTQSSHSNSNNNNKKISKRVDTALQQAYGPSGITPLLAPLPYQLHHYHHHQAPTVVYDVYEEVYEGEEEDDDESTAVSDMSSDNEESEDSFSDSGGGGSSSDCREVELYSAGGGPSSNGRYTLNVPRAFGPFSIFIFRGGGGGGRTAHHHQHHHNNSNTREPDRGLPRIHEISSPLSIAASKAADAVLGRSSSCTWHRERPAVYYCMSTDCRTFTCSETCDSACFCPLGSKLGRMPVRAGVALQCYMLLSLLDGIEKSRGIIEHVIRQQQQQQDEEERRKLQHLLTTVIQGLVPQLRGWLVNDGLLEDVLGCEVLLTMSAATLLSYTMSSSI